MDRSLRIAVIVVVGEVVLRVVEIVGAGCAVAASNYGAGYSG
jgi:hypothetical protein